MPRRRSARSAWLRGAGGVAAAGVLVVACGLEVLDLAPTLQLRSRWLTVMASFIGVVPVLLAGACLLLLVTLRGWWRLMAVALAILLVAQVVVAGTQRPEHAPIRSNFVVVTLNTYYGWADPAALAQRTEAADADVVVLPEVTTRTLAGLDRTDWGTRYPHAAGSAAGDWDDSGLMVFSRYPLTVEETSPRPGMGLRLEVGRPQGVVTLIGVHFANPMVDWSEWTADFAWVGNAVRRSSAAPVVVAGDLNAVPRHQQFRALLTGNTLRDTAAEVGALRSPTFPSSRSYPPPGQWEIPILQLDHVLVGPGVGTASVTTFRVDGTDHRGLVVRLRVD